MCRLHMRTGNDLLEEIHAKKGVLYGVTAEPQTTQDQTQQDWGLNFQQIGDPKNTLAKVLGVHLTDMPSRGFKFGMTQPAVIAVDRKGKLLFKWISVPSATNMGGASSRADLYEAWQMIQKGLAGEDVSTAKVVTHLLPQKRNKKKKASAK